MSNRVISAQRPWADSPRDYARPEANRRGPLATHRTDTQRDAFERVLAEIRAAGKSGASPSEIARKMRSTDHAVRRIANRLGYPVCEDDGGRLYWGDDL